MKVKQGYTNMIHTISMKIISKKLEQNLNCVTRLNSLNPLIYSFPSNVCIVRLTYFSLSSDFLIHTKRSPLILCYRSYSRKKPGKAHGETNYYPQAAAITFRLPTERESVCAGLDLAATSLMAISRPLRCDGAQTD